MADDRRPRPQEKPRVRHPPTAGGSPDRPANNSNGGQASESTSTSTNATPPTLENTRPVKRRKLDNGSVNHIPCTTNGESAHLAHGTGGASSSTNATTSAAPMLATEPSRKEGKKKAKLPRAERKRRAEEREEKEKQEAKQRKAEEWQENFGALASALPYLFAPPPPAATSQTQNFTPGLLAPDATAGPLAAFRLLDLPADLFVIVRTVSPTLTLRL